MTHGKGGAGKEFANHRSSFGNPPNALSASARITAVLDAIGK
jgi:hypothetical protein